MSNLTSASGEASVSSNLHPSVPNHNHPNPLKKKRSLPGNPDPEAEVVALSPKSLLATNRFMCEICNKGFQRDQNLQLHRRGHNLPWKLKQRGSKEVRKKVYVCPEKTCVHHDPARALGDLTGIKKHFCRKHGEKRWKCDKCPKKYAVQSDWKAHSKTCGTREYRCDCGTLFSRRDSFITHRAFCDALAEESARVISANPMPIHHPTFLLPQPTTSSSHDHHTLQDQTLKREQQRQDQDLTMGQEHVQLSYLNHSSHQLQSTHFPTRLGHDMPQDPTKSSLLPPLPHMSATALLQRAAQMGATMHRPSHMASSHTSTSCSAPSFSRFGVEGFVHEPNSPSMHGVMIPSSSATSEFDGSFEDGFEGMFGGKREENLEGGGNDDGYLTRDFLGLTNLSHSDILNFAGLESSKSSQYKQGPHQSSNEPWQ